MGEAWVTICDVFFIVLLDVRYWMEVGLVILFLMRMQILAETVDELVLSVR